MTDRGEIAALHPHDGVLVAGCAECVTVVKRAQREAEINAAPLRRCTWTCSYELPGDDEECGTSPSLRVTLDVRVPAGWTGWDVDDEYSHLTGDPFLMALPSSVLMEWTDYACQSMEVTNVAIGAIVPEPKQAPADVPSLFEVTQ